MLMINSVQTQPLPFLPGVTVGFADCKDYLAVIRIVKKRGSVAEHSLVCRTDFPLYLIMVKFIWIFFNSKPCVS